MICHGVSIRIPAYKSPDVERRGRKEKLTLPKTATAPSFGPSCPSLDQPRVALPFLGKFRPSRHLTSFRSKTELTLPKLTIESPLEKSQASYVYPTWHSVQGLYPSTVVRPMYKFPPSRPRTLNPSNLRKSLRTEYSGKDLELSDDNSHGSPRLGARK